SPPTGCSLPSGRRIDPPARIGLSKRTYPFPCHLFAPPTRTGASMSLHRRDRRLGLECLEDRNTPSGNLTVTFSALTQTLTIVGDSQANNLSVEQDGSDPTRFSLISIADSINGGSPDSPFETPSGVENIAIMLLGGDDSVILSLDSSMDIK